MRWTWMGWLILLHANFMLAQQQPTLVIPIPEYILPPQATVLKMAFASPRIRNPEALNGQNRAIRQVDIVLTRFPNDTNSWNYNYDQLMRDRQQALERFRPGTIDDPQIEWHIYPQTAAKNLTEAKEMLHGLVIHWAEEEGFREIPLPSGPLTMDSVEATQRINDALELLDGFRSYRDTTVHHLLVAHPEWQELILVSDMTASMFRHGAGTLHLQHISDQPANIRAHVFFNDGDCKTQDEKILGETGGIYSADGHQPDSIRAALKAVVWGGEGGDFPENDIEALLFAQNQYPGSPTLVLVADNSGRIRDLELADQLHRPVHIILIGVYHDKIQTDYLDLAYRTKGKVYIGTETLDPVRQQFFERGDYQYELRGDSFRRREIR